jgi:succinyl-diaminopimelate desuccinylase
VATFKGDSDPEIMLNGHLDVVPAPVKDFTPRVKGSRLYGRGSGDMKAGCAAMIEVMRYFAEQDKKPSLGLMLTADEEIGGFNGVGYLVGNKNYRPGLAIIPDGGVDLSTLVINEKGVLHLKVVAKGKAAHGSRPFNGENAVDKLIDIYTRLRKDLPHIKQNEWKNSMSLGVIQGGEATNKVPDYAEMKLDIRFIDRKEKNKILTIVERVAPGYEILAQASPLVQDKNNKYVKAYKEVAEKRTQKSIQFQRSEGASDARFFSEVGTPVISTKINCANIHGDNEWVDIRELVRFYEILVDYIKKLH